MSDSHPDDDDVDASYREAFSGLFGEDPQESKAEEPRAEQPGPEEPKAEEPGPEEPEAEEPKAEEPPATETVRADRPEQTAAEKTSQVAPASEHAPSDSGPVRFQETADAAASSADEEDVGGNTTAQLSTSWLDLAAGAEEEEETEKLEPPKMRTFLDDAGDRNSRASFAIDPSLVDPDLPALPPAMFVPNEGQKEPGEDAFEPGGETRTMEPLAAGKTEEELGHGGEETTRAMSESDVDDVLRDMEQRVRDLHAASPHDTAEDLILKKPLEVTVPDMRPPEVPETPHSTAKLLETWIRKNAGAGVHFEPVGVIEPPRQPVRLGAALEIGRSYVRYLELQPYESGRMVATRFEQVALAEPTGPSVDERLPRITAALATLRQRVGDRMAACTVLHEQGAIGTRVLTMPVGTRAVDAAVRDSLTAPEPLASAKRVMGKVRVGTDSIKSVLVSYAPAAEVARIEEALRLTGTPAARITSSQVVFLETVVAQAARLDEDAAEAFVFVERHAVTVALAARSVLLLARVLRLEKEPGTVDWQNEILDTLRAQSADLERACGGGELARIRYALALPAEVEFPSKEIVVAFGRPAEVIDIELLLKIDLDSVKQLSIPADAVAILGPAAYEATLGGSTTLDLGSSARGALVANAAWALVAALLLAVLGLAAVWQPDAANHRTLREQVEALDRRLVADEHVSADHAAALALRAEKADADKERAALDAFAARAPEVAAILRDVAPRPEGVFYERFHAVRTDPGRTTWDVELRAIGVGDKDRGAGLVDELVLRLRSSLAEVQKGAGGPGAVADEWPYTIGARSGGVK